jgi:MoaA/NifB/PqqE/SkfB family radical SAM enzyme
MERVRNLIERNRSLSLLYDAACQNRYYRSFVFKKIKNRRAFIESNKRFGFMIETSSICNARCTFCPNGSLSREKGIMTDEIFNLIISRIETEGITPSNFDLFLVGEPLIDKKIFDRIKLLKQHFPESQVRITSNFSLANSDIVHQLLNCGLDTINISLNSASLAGYRNIMGLDYAVTIDNIERLIKLRNEMNSRLKISLSMVLCKDNIGEEEKFIKMWINKVDSLRLQRASEWGGKVKGHERTRYNLNKFFFPCNEIFERIPILSNGDFAICCQDPEGKVGLNIATNQILRAFNSLAFQSLRQSHLEGKVKDNPMCQKCFAVNSNGANWVFTSYK